MAIITCGGGVSGIRGTLGGNTFSANTNGNFVRGWARPRNPRTYSQTIDRYYYQQWPAAWRAITPTQRTDWNDYAFLHPLTNKLGVAFKRSGYQWFCHCNQNLVTCSGSPVADAPLGEQPTAIEPLSLEYDDADPPYNCNVIITPDSFSGVFAVVFSQVVPFSGNMSWPSRYDKLRSTFSPDPSDTEIDCHIQHSMRYGSPAVGYKWFCRVNTMTTEGLRSAPWEANIEYTIP